jgi:hypothetical protein
VCVRNCESQCALECAGTHRWSPTHVKQRLHSFLCARVHARKGASSDAADELAAHLCGPRQAARHSSIAIHSHACLGESRAVRQAPWLTPWRRPRPTALGRSQLLLPRHRLLRLTTATATTLSSVAVPWHALPSRTARRTAATAMGKNGLVARSAANAVRRSCSTTTTTRWLAFVHHLPASRSGSGCRRRAARPGPVNRLRQPPS